MTLHIYCHIAFPKDFQFPVLRDMYFECGEFTAASASSSTIIVTAYGLLWNALLCQILLLIFLHVNFIITMLTGKFSNPPLF